MKLFKKGLFLVAVCGVFLFMGASQDTLTVFTIGDSTMAPYDTANSNPQRGWAQMLPQFFNTNVSIVNAARGGRSSKSFYNEGLWKAVIDKVKPGDYVFIQFAHNDEKTDTAYHTEPWTSFSDYLKIYIQETRNKGGIPILFTPIVRRYFDVSGKITATGQNNVGPGDSIGNYPMAMRSLAQQMNVPVIDLTNKTKQLVESFGPEVSKQLYISTDDTHPNILGATLIAQFAVQGIKEQQLPLSQLTDTASGMILSPKTIEFGVKTVNSFSLEKTFTISAFNLLPASGAINIKAPEGFQVSAASGSGFASSIDVNYSNGTMPTQIIYSRFAPASAKDYNGQIIVSSANLPSQSVNVTGSGVSVATGQLSSVSWYLTADVNVSSIAGPVAGVKESLSGMEVYNYTTVVGSAAGNSQRSRIIGGSWTAEVAQNNNRYIQFAVSPEAGVVFNVDSIGLYYGSAGGSGMRANIYYSTDSAFSSPVQLNTPGTPLSIANGMQLLSYNPILKLAAGQTLYLRIFPWYTTTATGKYVCLQNVTISGKSEGNVVVNLPTVLTTAIKNLSTNSAVCGGNITSDGKGGITARGVCWNTLGNPAINDNKTSDSTGTGIFTSTLTNLQKGTKYYLRAYAVNSAGTSYGSQDSLTTLTVLAVPTVTTTAMASVLVNSAKSGGNVTFWGGVDVTAKGVCWNTTGSPTIADSKTVDGTGEGQFSSVLTGLKQSQHYFIRAYATNSTGTGYGNTLEFTTQTPSPDVKKVVAQDGSGDYKTVQAALDSIPDNYTGNWTIYIKKGTYKEKLLLTLNKINVIMIGESKDSTILVYDDYVGKPDVATADVASFRIQAGNFTAYNITFQNTSHDLGQALAIKSEGDKVFYYNCRFLGYQDTYQGNGVGRVYFKNCYIEGTVDFIFGRSIMLFDNCVIKQLRDSGYLTAASTENTKFGIVFLDCKLTADSIGYNGTPITKFYLGRPWQAKPQTVFINCEEPATVAPEGWVAWNVTPALYAEYNCYGPGYQPSKRVSFSRQLTAQEATAYTVTNILSKSSGVGYDDWTPVVPPVIPVELTSFSAVLKNNSVSLTWSTATETNNKGFFIERKGNEEIWQTISFINGRGNSVSINQYSFTDNALETGNYSYRLKQIDFDGTYSYSTVVSISLNKKITYCLDANYPNPFNPSTKIRFSIPEKQHVTLKIYDVLGKEVKTLVNEERNSGQFIVEFNAGDFSSGIFFYQLKAGNFTQTNKMLLLK